MNAMRLALVANFLSATLILAAAFVLFLRASIAAIALIALAGAINPLGPIRRPGMWYYRHACDAQTPLQRSMADLLDARFGPLPAEGDEL